MDSLSLFTEALGLRDPWRVEACDLDAANGKLTLRLGWERGSRFPAKDGDGELYPVHDSEEREWRHLNFFQFETRLVARLPRVRDGEGRVVTAEVPWARSGSGFTLLMEALVMQLCKEMPVAAAARIVSEHDTRIWRVVHHYVGKAHAAESWEEVATVGIDEIATRKGHRYGTCFAEIRPDGTGRLLHLAPGKDTVTVAGFAEELGKHGASLEQIGRVAIDMSRAYVAGVRDHLPEAEKSFDRFHVMVHAGKAVDAVRKEVAREHGGLGKRVRYGRCGATRSACGPRRGRCERSFRSATRSWGERWRFGIPQGYVALHSSGGRGGPSAPVLCVGPTLAPATLREAGPDDPGALGRNPRLLPGLPHLRRDGIDLNPLQPGAVRGDGGRG
ncbi:MAG: ISL3 family transposase [Verrucomicrobiales bacterium]